MSYRRASQTLAAALALEATFALGFGPGCASTPKKGGAAAQAQPSAPPVRTEEDYTAARAEYDALGPTDAARGPRRRALLGYLVRESQVAIDRDHPEEAEVPFRQAISLYSPAELRGAGGGVTDGAGLLQVAQRFEAAFRRRGAHEQVLAALAVQVALAPNDAAPKQRFAEVVAWLEGTTEGDDDRPDGPTRVLEDLEIVAKVLPSPFVVDELARRYQQPRTPPRRGGRPSLRMLREMMNADQHATRAFEIARLFLRVSDPARAAAALKTAAARTPLVGGDADLQQLIERIAGKDGQVGDWIGLAKLLVRQGHERGSDDRDVALRVCRDAEARFEKALEPRLCSGQLALSMEQLVVAMHSFEAVRALDPTQRDAWEALAAIYQARLFQVVTEENLDVSRLPAELQRVETFHKEAAARFPQQPLKSGLAGAVFEVGRGYYNAGRIAEAERYLQRSIDLEPTVGALELLATVRYKRGDSQRAAVLLERAISLGYGEKEDQLYRRAKLRRVLADAIEGAGDAPLAEQTRRGAVEDWEVLLNLELPREAAAEALLERGKVLYQVGHREESLRSLARAIDAVPDRGSTYADVIAFLIPRGELAEALDAYHRALGRAEVTDYLKVYCSLWIVDLARRAGQPEDPQALAYLRAADGGKWFHDLARWATGRQSEAELMARATTPGRRAEAAFYRGMRALRESRLDEARALWKEVVATDMMAFFEYDMAGMYLKDGAPTQPRIQPKRPDSAPATRPRGAGGRSKPAAPAAPSADDERRPVPQVPLVTQPPDGSI